MSHHASFIRVGYCATLQLLHGLVGIFHGVRLILEECFREIHAADIQRESDVFKVDAIFSET